jgi:ABC-type long-subunit fatty acid transport system fused permease/ATPase subunit
MDRKFTALRIIGTIFKVLAWISLILGLLGAVGSLIAGFTLSSQPALLGLDLGGPLAGIAIFIVTLLFAIINFLMLYAAGEFIYLFLSVEENTRRMAYFMQQDIASQQAAYPSPSQPQVYRE